MIIIGLLEDGGRIWSFEDGRLIILRMEDKGRRIKTRLISGSAGFRSVVLSGQAE